jgi:hypothetical protein
MAGVPMQPLSKDTLAEQWFFLLQSVLSALQDAFRASGYTKEAVAKRIGKDPAFISRCFRGAQNMTLRTMHELARALDCRLRITLEPLNQLTPTNNRPQLSAGQPILKSVVSSGTSNVVSNHQSTTLAG